jgi:hypothetical protein
MTTPTTWPRSQHWRAEGFRITVLVYRSHRHETCHTCGRRSAIHSVWSDQRADGFEGGPTNFCDDHRPVKGTLPDLDYERISHDGNGTAEWTRRFERLRPNPQWPCDTCGQPSTVRREVLCDRCTDPAHFTVSTTRVLTLDGDRTDTHVGHNAHLLAVTYNCDAHGERTGIVSRPSTGREANPGGGRAA